MSTIPEKTQPAAIQLFHQEKEQSSLRVKRICSIAYQQSQIFVYVDLQDLYFGYCIQQVHLIMQNKTDLLNFIAMHGDEAKNSWLQQHCIVLLNSGDHSKRAALLLSSDKKSRTSLGVLQGGASLEDKIFKTKQQEAAVKESVMSQLFDLESFVYCRGSYQSDFSQSFYLLNEIKSVLAASTDQHHIQQKISQKHKNLVLFGDSGAEKSLFLSQLMKELLGDPQFNNFAIFFFKLRELSGVEGSNGVSKSKAQLKKLQDYVKQQQKQLSSNRQILLLLDGFDELNNKNIKIYERLRKTFPKQSQRLTILVTSSPHYAVYNEYLKCFGQHEVLNMCPFNTQQRNLYIEISMKILQRFKAKINDFETFETPQEYIAVLEQQSVLIELAQMPITLSLILTILPKIKREQEQFSKKQQQSSETVNFNKKFTKYEIYKIFEEQFTEMELKRILTIDGYKGRLSEYYQLNHFQDMATDDDLKNDLKKDIKLFHQLCCWKMLEKGKLVLRQEIDVAEVIQYIRVKHQKNFTDIADILERTAPVQISARGELQYIHKSIYEFIVAQSIIEETLAAKLQPVNLDISMLGQGYLAFDLDILSMVAENVSELPLGEQYVLYCESWYRSLLLTRKIVQIKAGVSSEDQERQSQSIERLEKIGSNCMSLLAALPRIDLTDRDFSECAMPHAYLYRCDLTGSKNLRAVMDIIYGNNNNYYY